MKNWKKYLALLAALLLVMSFAACTSVEEEPSDPPAESTQTPTNEMPTETPTEAPTEEATEEVTEASADYSAYMGNWYTGAVTFKVEKDNKWSMEYNGEMFLSGQIVVNEEDGSLLLYDVEGLEAAKIIMDAENSLYAELYTEELYNRIEDSFFTRQQSDDSNVIDIEESSDEEPGVGDSSDEVVDPVE